MRYRERMSNDRTDVGARPSWREVCGRIGWACLAIAAAVVILTGVEVFAASVGLALHGGLSVEAADAIMLRARITLGAVAAIAVMAVIASRWGLLAASSPFLLVLIVFTNGHLTTAE